MKSLLILFLFILYPLTAFAEIDERKIDVYFANGILTDEGNATANTRLLREAIISDIYSGNLNKFDTSIGDVTEAYNSTHGFLPDGFETYMQKFGVQGLLDLFALMNRYVTDHLEDIIKQVNSYKASIKDGHKVLVVAHSQGNLYTHEVYR